MTINKCRFCNKTTYTPICITDINDDGAVDSYSVCKECGVKQMKDLEGPSETPAFAKAESLDLATIKTPEELLTFLAGLPVKKQNKIKPCSCGMTEDEFDKYGRFGCTQCYTHFTAKIEELVFPFHGARSHVGKKPKHGYIESLMQNPVEKEKILKLRYAKAIELEEYEKCAEIKKELDLLKSSQLPESSSDQ